MVRRPLRTFPPRASLRAWKATPIPALPSSYRSPASPRSSSTRRGAEPGSRPPATDSALTFRQEEASLFLPRDPQLAWLASGHYGFGSITHLVGDTSHPWDVP